MLSGNITGDDMQSQHVIFGMMAYVGKVYWAKCHTLWTANVQHIVVQIVRKNVNRKLLNASTTVGADVQI